MNDLTNEQALSVLATKYKPNNQSFSNSNKYKLLWEKAFFEKLQTERNQADSHSPLPDNNETNNTGTVSLVTTPYQESPLLKLNNYLRVINYKTTDSSSISMHCHSGLRNAVQSNANNSHLTNANFISTKYLSRIPEKGAAVPQNILEFNLPKEKLNNIIFKKSQHGYEIWVWDKSLDNINTRDLRMLFNDYVKFKDFSVSRLTVNGKQLWRYEHSDQLIESTPVLADSNYLIDKEY